MTYQALSHYQLAKELDAEGHKREGKDEKDKGNALHAGYQAFFKAVKAVPFRERDAKTKKIKIVADIEDDAEAGILALTQHQFKMLTGLKNDKKFPYIKTTLDVINRPLKFVKEKKKGRYAQLTDIVPSKNVLKPKIKNGIIYIVMRMTIILKIQK